MFGSKRRTFGMVLALIVLILSAIPVDLIAGTARGVVVAQAASGDEQGPVIASIEGVGNDADEAVEFTLDTCTNVRIHAMGEGNRYLMKDWGAIVNADTGQVVWQMHYFETDAGGGFIENRKVDRTTSLPAGNYRLTFHTNGSHSFEDWGRRVPDDRFWGIGLYEDTSPERGAPACWDQAERPEDLGWSSRRLRRIVPTLERLHCAAFMVVTDGKVVFEWGNTANNFQAHSMRKSLLSGLYGIYVTQGAIDTSETLVELGIDDKVSLTDEEKQATVADLLKARSGVYIPAAGEAPSMRESRPKRGSHAHDTFWYYNNWDFNALGTIFDQETGEENIYQAFETQIAGPIGMQDYAPERLRYGYESQSMHPYYGFRISARDLARFGQLYLQEGEWQGRQVIPAEWVQESTYPYSHTGDSGTYSGYGYMWWIATQDHRSIRDGSYAASGYGGHTVEVLPDLNTVIVFRINTDDPTIPLVGASQVDQLVLGTLKASNRTTDAGSRTIRIANLALLVWGALVVGALCYLAWDAIRARALSWQAGLAWGAVMLLWGPIGLLAYLFVVRRPGRAAIVQTSPWWRALAATLYSMVGYGIAWALLIVVFVYVLPSRSAVVTLLMSYGALFAIGTLLFRTPLLASAPGVGYGTALRRSLLPEAISTNLALAGMFPVAFLVLDGWFLALGFELTDSPFWWVLLLTAAASGATVYPYNAWLAHRRQAAWPGKATGDGARDRLRLRSAWPALVVSPVVMLASMVLCGLLLG